ncbi:MAG: hypothetical protein J0M12_10095 [Deltaproteobacteria bacterium]|nr:hypothetical protein [Deltaproteobacteria bacterium]
MESQISLRRALLIGLGVGALGVLLLFRALIGKDLSATLWADNYDARLLHWIAEWGYTSIVERRDPFNFWNAPSFYPHLKSLAASDSLLSAQIFYSPLRLLGLSSGAALYATLAAVSILGCVLSVLALRRIGSFSPLEIAVIAFVCHFGLSITAYFAHYQLFGFQLAAPFFLFWYLFLREWRARDLLTVAACFAFSVCFSTYLAPMLTVTALGTAIPSLWRLHKQRAFGATLRSIGLRSLVGTIALGIFVFAVQLAPYRAFNSEESPKSLEESALYSAKPNSFLAPAFGGNSYWYQPRGAPTRFGDTERAFFPGFLISYSLVAFLFIWIAHAYRWYGAAETVAPGIDQRFLNYLAILLGLSIVLAFGPYLPFLPALKFPFYFLTWIVPGLEHVRTPGRFGIFTALPAIIFSLCLLRTFFYSRHFSRVLAAFALGIVVETLPRFDTFPFHPDADGVYAQLKSNLPAGAAVIELPTTGGDSLRTLLRVTDQLHGTLIHGGKIVLGYGASTTPEMEALNKLDLRIQRRKSRPADALLFGERLNVNYFIIRLNRYAPPVRERWLKLAREQKSVETLFADEKLLILRRT